MLTALKNIALVFALVAIVMAPMAALAALALTGKAAFVGLFFAAAFTAPAFVALVNKI